jgi:hypothetical protein
MHLAPIAAQLHAPPLGGRERGLCTLADGLSLDLRHGGQDVNGQLVGLRHITDHEVNARFHQRADETHVTSGGTFAARLIVGGLAPRQVLLAALFKMAARHGRTQLLKVPREAIFHLQSGPKVSTRHSACTGQCQQSLRGSVLTAHQSGYSDGRQSKRLDEKELLTSNNIHYLRRICLNRFGLRGMTSQFWSQ